MRGSELLLRKKAVFVPLLKRNIVLSVVLKAPRTHTTCPKPRASRASIATTSTAMKKHGIARKE
jgi:hypothetical protein